MGAFGTPRDTEEETLCGESCRRESACLRFRAFSIFTPLLPVQVFVGTLPCLELASQCLQYSFSHSSSNSGEFSAHHESILLKNRLSSWWHNCSILSRTCFV